MFAMGGGVRGGKIYGDWPGLEKEQLHEGRDLDLTTDFRDVLGELVSTYMGNRDLRTVFPGYGGGPEKFRGCAGGRTGPHKGDSVNSEPLVGPRPRCVESMPTGVAETECLQAPFEISAGWTFGNRNVPCLARGVERAVASDGLHRPQ